MTKSAVGSIPMTSRLQKELGLPLTWVQDPGTMTVGQTLGSETGFFHVKDAPNAVDELGRKVIPVQEFVATCGVKSVYAVGGVAFGGAVLVLIFFSRDAVESRTVRTFMPLINLLKGALISQGSMTRVFRADPEKGDESTVAAREGTA